MKRIIKIRIIAFSLLLLWMSVIFIMSAQPADKSSQVSGGIVSKLIATLFNKFETLSVEEQASITNLLTTIVRKTAHFLEYLILGLLTYFSLSTLQSYKYKKITCMIFCVIYAISDEIHQYFVPGRACRIKDVIIDATGVAASLILMSIIAGFKKRKSGEFNAKKETD